MRVGVLFSGGKDSCLALMKASKVHEIVCLISLVSENLNSFMFHVPNIETTALQAEAIGLPLIQQKTKGEKEKELEDLRKAIHTAKAKCQIEGIVTGAIRSTYQASRVQKICDELGLLCLNPLWQADEIELLKEIVTSGFRVVISGVFAYPLDKSFLGREIDAKLIQELRSLRDKYGINPAGEGGEIETTVLDAPFFRKRVEVADSELSYSSNIGVFKIRNARLINK